MMCKVQVMVRGLPRVATTARLGMVSACRNIRGEGERGRTLMVGLERNDAKISVFSAGPCLKIEENHCRRR